MITASIKDQVLYYLCTHGVPEKLLQCPTDSLLTALEMNLDTFNAVMVQFQRVGLIEDLNLRRSHLSFILKVEAHDYAQKGGFYVQDEVFKANLKKLELEIEQLKKQLGPDKLDTLNKLSAIASAIFGGLALLPK